MLAAVLNGKRRGTGFAGKQLVLGALEGAEDVLTATVFERLAYLPDSLLAAFLDELLNLEEPVGVIDDLQFWPSWSLSGQRVEPDVVLYGTERSLLVEAKRYDDGLQQYAQQLARELVAGTQDGEIQRPVLLTIGGLQDYGEVTAQLLSERIDAELGELSVEYELVCRSWHQVYLALHAAVTGADADCQPGLQRLLNDIAATYEWHGLRTQAHRWLAQLIPVGIESDRYPVDGLFVVPDSPTAELATLTRPLSELPAPGIASGVFPIKTWSFRS